MQCDNLEMACETAFLNGLPITIESLSGDQFLLGLISEISNDGIKLDWIDGDGTLGTNLDWITYTEIDILTVAGAYETLVNRACR